MEYKKLIPNIFSMPDRPICRVEVVDFYKMESRPPYLEATVTILVKFKKAPERRRDVGVAFPRIVGHKRRSLMGQDFRLSQSPEKGDI